ncbi:MAG: hypothetical protein OHK93_003317 [Ramalina farinacea]|uniref:Uncharacterized protein n=1 Tax=Ramalina farinacea TaxID=258253 RepID=A0AA43TZP9_9LECA|nr:hypothetical protein [Ramalina farinacea]
MASSSAEHSIQALRNLLENTSKKSTASKENTIEEKAEEEKNQQNSTTGNYVENTEEKIVEGKTIRGNNEQNVVVMGNIVGKNTEETVVEETTGEEKNKQNIVKGNTVEEKTFEGENTNEQGLICAHDPTLDNTHGPLEGQTGRGEPVARKSPACEELDVQTRIHTQASSAPTSAAPTESVSTRPVTPIQASSTRASAMPIKPETSSFTYTTLLPNPDTSARLQKLRDRVNEDIEASSSTYTIVLPNPGRTPTK